MTEGSKNVRILPMFHAAGWTYPWSCVFAFARQVRQMLALSIYRLTLILDYAQDS